MHLSNFGVTSTRHDNVKLLILTTIISSDMYK